MAKISARGATEVARLKAKSESSGATYIYILTSDGRVLMRDSRDSGFTVAYRVQKKENLTREYLERYIALRGLTLV